MSVPTELRFWSKVLKSDGCWIWTAGKNSWGYGVIMAPRGSEGKRHIMAHRWAYESAYGVIPAGLDIDHLCRNRACVRPDHLEAVTHRVNVLRGVSPTAQNAKKVTCPKGHPYDKENTYLWREGERSCRRCNLENFNRRRAARAS